MNVANINHLYVMHITQSQSVFHFNEMARYYPKGDAYPLLPKLSNFAFMSKGKPIYLYQLKHEQARNKLNSNNTNCNNTNSNYNVNAPTNHSVNFNKHAGCSGQFHSKNSNYTQHNFGNTKTTRCTRNHLNGGSSNNKSNSGGDFGSNYDGKYVEIYQQESHNFQLCVIDCNIIFVSIYNCGINNVCDNNEDYHLRYKADYVIWRLYTVNESTNRVYYGVAEPNDKNYTKTYDKYRRPKWKLQSIMNENQLLAFFANHKKSIDVIKYFNGGKVEITQNLNLGLNNNYSQKRRRYWNSNSGKNYANNVVRFKQTLLSYLPQRIEIQAVKYDPNVPIAFNLDKISSSLRSNSNEKKYASLENDIKQLKCGTFDGLLSLMMASMYKSLFYSQIYPDLVQTQIYIDKYNGTYYQELVILLEVENKNILDKYHKYGLTFITECDDYGNPIRYVLNCINTANITLANIKLVAQNDELLLSQMYEEQVSFYKRIESDPASYSKYNYKHKYASISNIFSEKEEKSESGSDDTDSKSDHDRDYETRTQSLPIIAQFHFNLNNFGQKLQRMGYDGQLKAFCQSEKLHIKCNKDKYIDPTPFSLSLSNLNINTNIIMKKNIDHHLSPTHNNNNKNSGGSALSSRASSPTTSINSLNGKSLTPTSSMESICSVGSSSLSSNYSQASPIGQGLHTPFPVPSHAQSQTFTGTLSGAGLEQKSTFNFGLNCSYDYECKQDFNHNNNGKEEFGLGGYSNINCNQWDSYNSNGVW